MQEIFPTLTSRRVSSVRRALTVCALGLLAGVLYLLHARQIVYFEVTSGSMEPTIEIGDRLLMTKARRLSPGDIVVFDKPDQAPEPLVKRLVALGPSHVEQRDGWLYVDGVRSDEPGDAAGDTAGDLRDGDHPSAVQGPQPDHEWTLHDGEAFVAGDNRAAALDSRDYGPIPVDTIRGIVSYRLAPRSRQGFVK